MKTLIATLAVLAFAVPAAFAAGGASAASPAQACKTELKTMGAADFKALYAPGAKNTNAMGKCVSKHQKAAAANTANAAKTCKAEQDMKEADFRAAHDGKSFAEVYGKNANDKNAYGKCVSAKASAASAQQESATMKASKACKTERGSTTESRAACTAKYGGKASSAFGKCVSAKSKTQ
jgi:hypothetical protein